MPVKNIYKEYVPQSYYHIYNRGVNKGTIFNDTKDYAVFLSLLKRYLGDDIEKTPNREFMPNYYKDVELLAFCLIENHFHLFIYQYSSDSITKLMKSLSIAYSMYFNKRHKRIGPLFQQRYKAVRITDDAQLLHITRYIHMNPTNYQNYQWSSLPYYIGERTAPWLRPGRIIELFKDAEYMSFLDDYVPRRQELKELSKELADA